MTETIGGIVWSQDASAFYYVHLDRNHRPVSVHRHRLGTRAADDETIVAADDSGLFVSLTEAQSGRYAEVSLHDHETSESWLIDLAAGGAARLVAPRETSVRYRVEHHPDFGGEPGLLILTNADGAEDFKIAWTPLAASGRDHWRDVVPHRPGVYILTLHRLRRLADPAGARRRPRRASSCAGSPTASEHTIAFDEEAYSLGFDAGYEFATDTLRFSYSSMTTPSEVWDYDLDARTRRLRKRQEIPSGHDPAAYVTRRLFAPAPDGEKVPVSLLYRKGTPLDGTAPALLYGYGAYGMSIPAAFASNRLSLADRGFILAIAHVRGGTEKGWRWYREGKLAQEAEHVFRLHRRDRIPHRREIRLADAKSSPTAPPRAAC